MTDHAYGLTVPQFVTPDPNANTATVPDEFARYSDALAQSFGPKPPESAGMNTTALVGE